MTSGCATQQQRFVKTVFSRVGMKNEWASKTALIAERYSSNQPSLMSQRDSLKFPTLTGVGNFREGYSTRKYTISLHPRLLTWSTIRAMRGDTMTIQLFFAYGQKGKEADILAKAKQ